MKLKFYMICMLLPFVATTAFSQAKKPTIMVVPSETLCMEKDFTTTYDDYGTTVKAVDYERAALDGEIRLVIAKIGEMMAERSFPLERLDATIRNIETSGAKLQYMSSRNGGSASVSPLEKIMQTARPDIRLELYYKVNQTGPRKSVSFEMTGIDAYTNVQVASASGVGEPSFSSSTDLLLQEAVLTRIDQFCSQLQSHFDDMFANGREVSVSFRCSDECEFDFYTQVDGIDLCEIIEDVMSEKTVQGRYNLQTQDDRVLVFNRVRIPLQNESGRAIDANNWVRRDVVRALKAKMLVNPDDKSPQAPVKLEMNPKIYNEGLGMVTVMF